jgi:addiction module RelE/StbE family toxin
MDNRKYKVKMTPLAESDLGEIYQYIASNLYNEVSAKDIILSIKQKIKRLEDFPLSCALVRDEVWAQRGYRMLVVGKYLVFYKVDEANKLVIIVRILFGSRDYAELL